MSKIKMSQLIEDAEAYYEGGKYPDRQQRVLVRRLAQHMKDTNWRGLITLVNLVTVRKTESFKDAFKRTISVEASKKEPSLSSRLTSIGNGLLLILGIIGIICAVLMPVIAPAFGIPAALCLITLLIKCAYQSDCHNNARDIYECSKQLQTETMQMETSESISSLKTVIEPNLTEPVQANSPVSWPGDRLDPADRIAPPSGQSNVALTK